MEGSVAQVVVDTPLPHLDRPFDYRIPEALSEAVQPGVRVKVRFAGRLLSGVVLDRVSTADRDGLSEIAKVISTESVLTPPVSRLIRTVADHYCGTFADVLRTAIPPRHAATEKATTSVRPEPRMTGEPVRSLACYPDSDRLLAGLSAGERVRAAWTVVPTPGAAGDWAQGFVEAAEPVLRAGRGVLLLAPDARALTRLEAACTERFAAGSFAILNADSGPSARYRNFLAVLRGQVQLVIGTRAAVFAPVRELGLVALWDDGSDSYAEPHAPYWHAREVAALRAHGEGSALILAAHARTAEVQQLVDRGWLAALELPPAGARRLAAAVRPIGPDSARDPLAGSVRVPKDVFTAIRTALAAGPVVVQVPRAGYQPIQVCAQCREVAACRTCGQPLTNDGAGPVCRWCGPPKAGWSCPQCAGTRLRSPVIGVSRTAEELGKAFPGVPVIQASAEHPVASVPDRPALVLATPGSTPSCETGYAAGILLDAALMLSRPELRAGEEALRRWLAVTATVRPGEAGGTVVVVGDPTLREVQALVRLDPVGYGVAELNERRQAGFAPAIKMVTVEGSIDAVTAIATGLELPHGAAALGPFDLPGEEGHVRLTLRCPPAAAPALLSSLKQLLGARAAHKESPVRVRVDPQVMD